jgi:hypothetical protein
MPVSQTLNVHVRVNDAATGKPTPVRLRFADADGKYYPPLGRPAEFPIGRNEDVGGHVYLNGKRYAYVDGTCEVPLPTKVPLNVEISKGPGYLPIQMDVTLGEGQMALRFTMKRWGDGRWDDLLATDTRCHFLSPHAAKLEATAEGIDLVNLLATVQAYPSQDGHMYRTIPNITAFSGQQPALESVYVNTFNYHPALGRLGLLNCHRAVYPLTFGHMEENDDWSLSDWCDQCHRKKGLVTWCDAYRPEAGLPGGEALINAILGKIDVIEFDAHERSAPFLTHWYRLLNAGIRLPIVGGSGKDSNRIVLGGMRTLTPIDESRSYSDWVECVRMGKTVAGNGPAIRLSVNEQFSLPTAVADSSQPLRIRASAVSRDPAERLETIADGEVIGSTPWRNDEKTVLEIEHAMPASGWIAARCWGAAKSDLYPHFPVFAHTSPVWVEVAGRPFESKPAAVLALQREIGDVRHWVETTGRFTNPRRKEHLLSLCDAASGHLANSTTN